MTKEATPARAAEREGPLQNVSSADGNIQSFILLRQNSTLIGFSENGLLKSHLNRLADPGLTFRA
jgi:hypothetical protein